MGCRPIHQRSDFPIYIINNQVVVKRIERIPDFQANPDASDQLQKSSPSPSQPPSKNFHRHIIPSTPRDLQPSLSAVPASVTQPTINPSTTTKPSLTSPAGPASFLQSRPSPMSPPQTCNLCPEHPIIVELKDCHYNSQLPNCFKEESGGLSELTQRIQRWVIRVNILWPGCSVGLKKELKR
ncbi:hypothetical protein O181_032323 [Austropuccinia psidii MF-1]|uniref:Uncharacterized protein n=1 Tax=Austropuccinia psidii MF-1 TaxID=1389203 RepID=A0A9Q3H5E5_9BASI|nr:hypothetical protein [Austropuccinia psidii MF-1]